VNLPDVIVREDDRLALVDPVGARTLTHAELAGASERIATRLGGAGVQGGDTVALMGPNGPDFVAAFLGTLRAGAAVAPLNPAYTTAELETYLDDLGAAAMLLLDGVGDAPREACARLGVRLLEVAGASSAAIDVIGVPDSARPLPHVDDDAVALVLHTSGTTGAPKGVYLRHRNLVASIGNIAAGYELTADDVSYCVMPLFHVHGLVASTFAALARGGTVVVPPRFSASSFWGDVAQWGATWFSAVPTIHRTLLLRSDDAPIGSAHTLRFARSCSSALAPTVWREFERRFGVPLVEAYGMTEASHQMSTNPLPPAVRRPGTVGVATGIEVAVLDGDWRAVPAGEPGEVAVRGASVVDEYRGNPEATAASFRDGWFRTGDRGVLSSDGYLTLEGRIKELINRGGEKISPHEVEDALLSHPDVADAVAFARPDEKYGECVAAVVVAAGPTGVDVDALRDHCAERLARFKVPDTITVAAAIPKGPTGKVQRRLMAGLLGS
jgi:oxalate---CoA ligase